MPMTLNDETLVAYVDGQLDSRETAEVEAKLLADAEARDKVDGLRRNTALLRAAFNEPLEAPIPERVLRTVEDGFARRREEQGGEARRGGADRGRYAPPGPWRMAWAASLLALMVGAGGGYLAADYRVEQRLAALEAAAAADRAARQQAFLAALESSISGQSVAWENPDSGRRGAITPVRTFKTVEGQWCREYAADEWLGQKQEISRAIACRVGDGLWKTRLLLIEET